jgi:hypothetical protein
MSMRRSAEGKGRCWRRASVVRLRGCGAASGMTMLGTNDVLNSVQWTG